MSDHEGLLRGLFAAADAGDLDSFDRYLHDDVVGLRRPSTSDAS